MAFTLSSSSGAIVVDGLVATYNATMHGIGGLLYVAYTKGAEDGVRIALSYGSKGVHVAERYQHVSVNLSTRILTPTSYVLTATGRYRIPVTWTREEINLTFTFSQYGAIEATGVIDVIFREAE
jgi:hypothetical protein